MNDKKSKIIELLEDSVVLNDSISWWIKNTENIIAEIDRVEAEPDSPKKDKILERLLDSLRVLTARKRIEEKNIDDLIKRIDRINQ